MKILIRLIILITAVINISCATKKKAEITTKQYEVLKIDSLNNFYIIYAQQNNMKFKIVSKKQEIKNCKKIKSGQFYNFQLVSILNQPIKLGDITINHGANLLVNCFMFEGNTEICRESDIPDLHRAENLSGLCLLKN